MPKITTQALYKAMKYALTSLNSEVLPDSKGSIQEFLNYLTKNSQDSFCINENIWNLNPTEEDLNLENNPDLAFPLERIKTFLNNENQTCFILPLLLGQDCFAGCVIRKEEGTLKLYYLNPTSTPNLDNSNKDQAVLKKLREELSQIQELNLEALFNQIEIVSDEQQQNKVDSAYIVSQILLDLAQGHEISIQKYDGENLQDYVKKIAQVRAQFYQDPKTIKNQWIQRLGKALTYNQVYAKELWIFILESEDDHEIELFDLIKNLLSQMDEKSEFKDSLGLRENQVTCFLINKLKITKLARIKNFCEKVLEPIFPEQGEIIFRLSSNLLQTKKDPESTKTIQEQEGQKNINKKVQPSTKISFDTVIPEEPPISIVSPMEEIIPFQDFFLKSIDKEEEVPSLDLSFEQRQLKKKGLIWRMPVFKTFDGIKDDIEFLRIYEGKYGPYTYKVHPEFIELGGCAIKSLYKKAHGNPDTLLTEENRWMGKIGNNLTIWEIIRSLNSWGTVTERTINEEGIKEKIAFDVYYILSRGEFNLPKTRLSRQPIQDRYTLHSTSTNPSSFFYGVIRVYNNEGWVLYRMEDLPLEGYVNTYFWVKNTLYYRNTKGETEEVCITGNKETFEQALSNCLNGNLHKTLTFQEWNDVILSFVDKNHLPEGAPEKTVKNQIRRIESTLRVMSKWVEGYLDFKSLEVPHNNTYVPFMSYLEGCDLYFRETEPRGIADYYKTTFLFIQSPTQLWCIKEGKRYAQYNLNYLPSLEGINNLLLNDQLALNGHLSEESLKEWIQLIEEKTGQLLPLPTHSSIPEHIRIPETNRTVPLKGFLSLLATATSLSDTDWLGAKGENAGIIFLTNKEGNIYEARVVKIDPGFAFNYGGEEDTNWRYNTQHNLHDRRKCLNDLRDIQFGNNYGVIPWKCLTKKQKDKFLEIKHHHLKLNQRDILWFLFYREGRFHAGTNERWDEKIAQKYVDAFQVYLLGESEIYHNDLKEYEKEHQLPLNSYKKGYDLEEDLIDHLKRHYQAYCSTIQDVFDPDSTPQSMVDYYVSLGLTKYIKSTHLSEPDFNLNHLEEEQKINQEEINFQEIISNFRYVSPGPNTFAISFAVSVLLGGVYAVPFVIPALSLLSRYAYIESKEDIKPIDLSIYDFNLNNYQEEVKDIYSEEEKINQEVIKDISSHLDIENNRFEQFKIQKILALSELFEMPSDPKKWLITGGAGSGKTTLCQYICYQWSKDIEYLKTYKIVFWIKLRNLTTEHYPNDQYTLFEIINKECFQGQLTKQDKKILENLIKTQPCLFVLDGYDERPLALIEGNLHSIWESLVQQPYLVITSRPQSFDMEIDHHLKLLPLTEKQMEGYIQRYIQDDNQVKVWMNYLERQPKLKELASIPITLTLICQILKEKQDVNLSMTRLYQHMTEKLFQRYYTKQVLEKEVGGFLIRIIEQVAWQGMLEQRVYFNDDDFLTAIDKVKQTLSEELLYSLSDYELLVHLHTHLGLFKPIEAQNTQTCFIHLSLQEYFAANYIARLFLDPRRELNPLYQAFKESCFLYKFDPRFEMVWKFAAGLLNEYEDSLSLYLKLLKNPPHDFLNENEADLWLQCLEEIDGFNTRPSTKEIFESIKIRWETAIQFILSFKIKKLSPFLQHVSHYPHIINEMGDPKGVKSNIQEFVRIPHFFQPINKGVPDRILALALLARIHTPHCVDSIIKNPDGINAWASLNIFANIKIKGLESAVKSYVQYLHLVVGYSHHKSAVFILKSFAQAKIPGVEEAILPLIQKINGIGIFPRKEAISALRAFAEAGVPGLEPAVGFVTQWLNWWDFKIKREASLALKAFVKAKISGFELAIDQLIKQLSRGKSPSILVATLAQLAEIVTQELEPAVTPLIKQLFSQNSVVRRLAIQAVGQFAEKRIAGIKQAINPLFQLLKNHNKRVQNEIKEIYATLEKFRQFTPLDFEQAIISLLEQLNDKSNEVRKETILILHQLSKVPIPGLELAIGPITEQLNNENKEIRMLAILTLHGFAKAQVSKLEKILNFLLDQLNNNDKESEEIINILLLIEKLTENGIEISKIKQAVEFLTQQLNNEQMLGHRNPVDFAFVLVALAKKGIEIPNFEPIIEILIQQINAKNEYSRGATFALISLMEMGIEITKLDEVIETLIQQVSDEDLNNRRIAICVLAKLVRIGVKISNLQEIIRLLTLWFNQSKGAEIILAISALIELVKAGTLNLQPVIESFVQHLKDEDKLMRMRILNALMELIKVKTQSMDLIIQPLIECSLNDENNYVRETAIKLLQTPFVNNQLIPEQKIKVVLGLVAVKKVFHFSFFQNTFFYLYQQKMHQIFISDESWKALLPFVEKSISQEISLEDRSAFIWKEMEMTFKTYFNDLYQNPIDVAFIASLLVGLADISHAQSNATWKGCFDGNIIFTLRLNVEEEAKWVKYYQDNFPNLIQLTNRTNGKCLEVRLYTSCLLNEITPKLVEFYEENQPSQKCSLM